MPVIVQKGGGAGIEGLDKFRRDLRKMDKDIAKEIKDINLQFSERVANEARNQTSAYGPVAVHFKGGIQASKRGTSVFVGIKETPGIFGAEFGGGLFGPGHPTAAGGHTTQFGPHRGRVGGAMWFAIHDMAPKLVDEYSAMLDKLWARAEG